MPGPTAGTAEIWRQNPARCQHLRARPCGAKRDELRTAGYLPDRGWLADERLAALNHINACGAKATRTRRGQGGCQIRSCEPSRLRRFRASAVASAAPARARSRSRRSDHEAPSLGNIAPAARGRRTCSGPPGLSAGPSPGRSSSSDGARSLLAAATSMGCMLVHRDQRALQRIRHQLREGADADGEVLGFDFLAIIVAEAPQDFAGFEVGDLQRHRPSAQTKCCRCRTPRWRAARPT